MPFGNCVACPCNFLGNGANVILLTDEAAYPTIFVLYNSLPSESVTTTFNGVGRPSGTSAPALGPAILRLSGLEAAFRKRREFMSPLNGATHGRLLRGQQTSDLVRDPGDSCAPSRA